MQAPDAFGAVVSRAPNLDMLGWARRGLGTAATVEYGSLTIPSRARISPAIRRITTSEPIVDIR